MMRSLRTQLSMTIALIVLVAVALISFLANLLINRDFESYIAYQQRQKSSDIAANLARQYNRLTGEWDDGYIHGTGMYALEEGYILRVFDANGRPVWDAQAHDTVRCAQVMDEIAVRMERHRPDVKGEFASHTYALEQNGEKIGTASIGYYGPFFFSEGDVGFLAALNTALLLIGGLALVFSFIAGGILAKRIARPITKTSCIVKQISEGNYDIRFSSRTKTKELDDLTAAVNHMAASLGKQEKLRKQHTTDVAHELRTPLTAIGSHLEAMTLGIWEPTAERLKSCQEEVGRLSALVSDLERLARAENAVLSLNRERIDLREAARFVCGTFEVEAAKKGLRLTVEGDAAYVYADRDRISQVITNLLSNAIKYTPKGGRIRILVENLKDRAALTVEDTGPGILESELPFVFERFYRADKSRNRDTGGAGIGLAIAKAIVTAHGGAIKAESTLGKGSRFSIELYGDR